MTTCARSRGAAFAVVVLVLSLAPSASFAAGPKTIGTISFVGRPGLEGIAIVGFAWSAGFTSSGSPGGSGVGKATFDPFRVVKLLDAAAPALLDLTVSGTSTATVRVDVTVRRGVTASYELADVLVIGNERHLSENGGAALQELSLSVSVVRETLVTPGGTVTSCFSLKTEKACD
jgi:type VI protein secretion system component Hcp